jgi:hypothetical protein
MAWAVQWLRLALSKRPNRAGLPSFPWRRKRIQFPKRCVFQLFRILDEGQSPQIQWFWKEDHVAQPGAPWRADSEDKTQLTEWNGATGLIPPDAKLQATSAEREHEKKSGREENN